MTYRSRCSAAAAAFSLAALMAAGSLNAQSTPASDAKPTLTAKLVDQDKKAAEQTAVVEVTVTGVQLVDPAMSKEQPAPGQAHLHYQLDKGPVIATPTAKLSWHELTPGPHSITVVLSGNDHKPLGPQAQLSVTVPGGPKGTSGVAPVPTPAPAAGKPPY